MLKLIRLKMWFASWSNLPSIQLYMCHTVNELQRPMYLLLHHSILMLNIQNCHHKIQLDHKVNNKGRIIIYFLFFLLFVSTLLEPTALVSALSECVQNFVSLQHLHNVITRVPKMCTSSSKVESTFHSIIKRILSLKMFQNQFLQCLLSWKT